MKKVFSLVFNILLLLVGVLELKGQGIQTHLNLGIAGTQIDGDGIGGYNKPGIFAGAGVDFPINKSSLHWDLLYFEKGSRSSSEQSPFVLRLNYLELPFYWRYQIADKFSFHAGLAVGYIIRAREVSGAGNFDWTAQLKKYDFSALLGFDYEIDQTVLLTIRHEQSVVPYNHYRILGRNFYNRSLVFAVSFKL